MAPLAVAVPFRGGTQVRGNSHISNSCSCTASSVRDTVPDMADNTKASKGTTPASEAFASDLLRGHTDTIVLATLRDTDRYGYEIYKTIRDATGGEYEIKEATLYATFRRLVNDGLVEAHWGDESQGGRRKYYAITDAGRAVFRRAVADWTATQRIINTLLELKGSPS